MPPPPTGIARTAPTPADKSTILPGRFADNPPHRAPVFSRDLFSADRLVGWVKVIAQNRQTIFKLGGEALGARQARKKSQALSHHPDGYKTDSCEYQARRD
jgi:hypothetical protein